KERPVQRIGLIEHCQHVQPAIDDQAFERDFVAGDELLDEILTRSLATRRRSLRIGEDGAQSSMRRYKRLRIVGANDATRCGQAYRLEHARIRDGIRDDRRIFLEVTYHEARDG